MDGENTNGGQEATQGGTQEQEVQGKQQEPQAAQEVGGGTDWERQIADRDARIAELVDDMSRTQAADVRLEQSP